MKTIDLRSDTVTRPSRGMLEAMIAAPVGDDVFGEDPTVNTLQERIAELFGKEAALFVPSGTMGNEICIKVHTRPGDEVILDEDSHITVYETGGPSFLSGVQLRPVAFRNGIPDPDLIRSAIRPSGYYYPVTRLVCLENTHGRSGGRILPLDVMRAVKETARHSGIAVHLDGARIWNASVASGIRLSEYARHVDSLSACFSKGLGAPIGSIIVGDRGFIEEARKYRKIFGGGMRQVGILAAAALYALDYNMDRLAEDHAKARFFARELGSLRTIRIDPADVETNMVIPEISATGKRQGEVLAMLREHGVLLTPERETCIRSVMHCDVTMDDVREAVRVFHHLFR